MESCEDFVELAAALHDSDELICYNRYLLRDFSLDVLDNFQLQSRSVGARAWKRES